MQLKKGSYLYIIGMFSLFAASFAATVSFFLGLAYRSSAAGENPLLLSFGSNFAGSLPALVITGIFSATAWSLAVFILRYGLRTNSLSVPFRAVGIAILPLSLAMMVLVWLLFEQGDTFTTLAVRVLHALPSLAFGIYLIRVSKNRKNSRMPTMFFGAMSAYAAFSGFGYARLFYAYDGVFTLTYFRGWLSAFLFSLSLCLFYAGVCLCVGGCKRKEKNKMPTK